MTDWNPPHAPSDQLAAWSDKERQHVSQADALRLTNKTALFDALGAAGITTVMVTFDGYGDSGQVEAIEARTGDKEAALPDWPVTLHCPVWGSTEVATQTMLVSAAIEHFVYESLRLTHEGWENNDGASGDFRFDVAARTITLDFSERYIATEHHQHVF